jgi:hypothetical protein
VYNLDAIVSIMSVQCASGKPLLPPVILCDRAECGEVLDINIVKLELGR